MFLLYSGGLTYVLLTLSDDFIYAVVGLCMFSVMCFFVGYKIPSKKPEKNILHHFGNKMLLVKELNFLFGIAAFIFLMTIIFFQGVPLFWLLQGSTRTYTEFGFPTIHGFFNSLLLLLGSILFWLELKGLRYRFSRFILILCILVPVITLHRQSLVTLLLQCLFIYMAVKKKGGLRFLVFLMGIGFLFSFLGDIRTGGEVLMDQAQISQNAPELSSSVVWLYLYLTTPLSNFYELTTMDFVPTYGSSSLAGLTPTVIREALWGGQSDVAKYFADMTFNAYTYAFVPYMDFKWWGVFLFTGGVLGYAGLLYKRYLNHNNLYNLLNLCLLNTIIFLFIFANFLITWGVLFQFVMIGIWKKRLSAFGA